MDSQLSLWPLVLGPLSVTALAVPFVKRLAWRYNLVDRPETGAHKSHEQPTPYGGAIAIFCGLLLSLYVVLPYLVPILQQQAIEGNHAWLLGSLLVAGDFMQKGADLSLLLAGGFALFLLGLADDWRGLPPLPRFLAQLFIITAVVATLPACRLSLFPEVPLLNMALTVFWLTAMSNAFNFLDNMDGLSAGIAAINLIFLAFMALLVRDFALATFCLVLFGALCGFLLYNLPPATIFMGDAGGLFLGYSVAAIAVLLSQTYAEATLFAAHQLASLLVLAVPVYDFASVNLIRIRTGSKPWIGDKNNISHRLVRLGLSRRGAVLAIYLVTTLTGLSALLALHFNQPSWIAIGPLLIGVIAIADRLSYRAPESA
jgi:UDP-GlcNAc:undecaprenyl-phosphate GlcNAc-1-phosphate transferase